MSEPFKSLEEMRDSFQGESIVELFDFLDRLTATMQTHELRKKGEWFQAEKDRAKLTERILAMEAKKEFPISDDGMTGDA